MEPNDIRLTQTCEAYPEQYDALQGDEMVGYLRLRHGHFTIRCPDALGKIVYEAYPIGDGAFDDDERDNYLKAAKETIAAWWNDKRNNRKS